jgi:septation ring formation regulator EzrA
MTSTDGNWNEWQRHVLGEQKRVGEAVEKINDRLTNIEVRISQLEVRSGLWGAIGALVAVAALKLTGTALP